MSKDYYKILGVDKKASKDEIKKAFRSLAHKYHPDKSNGDEGKFKEINEAYTVLSDEKKRAEYDAYGQTFGGGNPFGQGAGGFDFSQFAQAFGGNGQSVEFDFGDIFGDFFGGGRQGRVRRGRDISVDIDVPFAEAVFGTTRSLIVSKIGVCDECTGSGAEKGSATKKCATCDGSGKVHETRSSFIGTFSTVAECPECHGRGEIPEKKCAQCNGVGIRKKQEEIDISIPAGIDDGAVIRMAGMGEATPGGAAGDFYVKVHVKPHPVFKKEGANLVMPLDIKLTDAMLGAKYDIETLDGKITLQIPEGVSPAEILRVRGRGVPVSKGKRGDLLVKIKIRMPEKLSRKARTLFKDLREEGI